MTTDTGASSTAAATSATHASQTQTIGHQSTSGDQGNGQGQSSTSGTSQAADSTSGQQSSSSSSQTSTTQATGTQKPDAATMKSYLIEKTQDGKTALEGKSDAEIEALYGALKTKESADAAATFKLPDEYKDKPWASKVKSQDDLYKQIDNLTALVGKKVVVPDLKTATPEEKEAFYSQLRGKDAAEYAMPKTNVPIPDDTQPAVAKLFMDNGISPAQAEPFLKGYLELREKQIAEYYNPEGFKKSMETAFGSDWEKTTGQVRNTIKGMMNADDQKALDAIPNNLLGLVYRTLGNVVKSYGIKETDTAHFQASGKAAPSDIGNVRQGLRDQLAALSMRPHTTAEQQDIITKLNETYTNDPRLKETA